MIVDDFHIVTMALTPDKTDSPLIIDPNRVLPFPIASQCFQLISRRRSQNAQLRRSVKLEQFPQGNPLDGTEPPAVVIMKELLSFLRAKALNHTHRILRHALYVKQRMSVVTPRTSESASEECLAGKAATIGRY
jgi:hypothetical protein